MTIAAGTAAADPAAAVASRVLALFFSAGPFVEIARMRHLAAGLRGPSRFQHEPERSRPGSLRAHARSDAATAYRVVWDFAPPPSQLRRIRFARKNDYNQRLRTLADRWPARVLLVATENLGDGATQRQIFEFLGLAGTPSTAAQRGNGGRRSQRFPLPIAGFTQAAAASRERKVSPRRSRLERMLVDFTHVSAFVDAQRTRGKRAERGGIQESSHALRPLRILCASLSLLFR
jgi:hypothetical protein